MKKMILFLLVPLLGCQKSVHVRQESYQIEQKKELLLFPIQFSKTFSQREREEEIVYELKEKLKSEGYLVNLPQGIEIVQNRFSIGAHVQNALRINEEEFERDSMPEKCQSIYPKIEVCFEIRFFSSEINLYDSENNSIRMYIKIYKKNENKVFVRQIIWPREVLLNHTLMNDVFAKMLEGI